MLSAVGCRGEIPTEILHTPRVRRRSAPGGGLGGTTHEGPEALRHASVET
jgi:hypothetical protein